MRGFPIALAAAALLAVAPAGAAERAGTVRIVATVFLDSGGTALPGVQLNATARFGAFNYTGTATVTAVPKGGRVAIELPYRLDLDPAATVLRVSLTASSATARRATTVNLTLPLPRGGVTTVYVPAAL